MGTATLTMEVGSRMVLGLFGLGGPVLFWLGHIETYVEWGPVWVALLNFSTVAVAVATLWMIGRSVRSLVSKAAHASFR